MQLGSCKVTEGALNPLIKIAGKNVNKTVPNTEPWGTQLVTGRQADLTPLTTILGPSQPDSCFFYQ